MAEFFPPVFYCDQAVIFISYFFKKVLAILSYIDYFCLLK
jgi:hypothetical protein